MRRLHTREASATFLASSKRNRRIRLLTSPRSPLIGTRIAKQLRARRALWNTLSLLPSRQNPFFAIPRRHNRRVTRRLADPRSIKLRRRPPIRGRSRGREKSCVKSGHLNFAAGRRPCFGYHALFAPLWFWPWRLPSLWRVIRMER